MDNAVRTAQHHTDELYLKLSGDLKEESDSRQQKEDSIDDEIALIKGMINTETTRATNKETENYDLIVQVHRNLEALNDVHRNDMTYYWEATSNYIIDLQNRMTNLSSKLEGVDFIDGGKAPIGE